MFAILLTAMMQATPAPTPPPAVTLPSATAQAADPTAECVDPATPLTELARNYPFPTPTSARGREAHKDLQQYFARPTPRAYHNLVTDYKWVEQMSPADIHVPLALGILYASGPDINLPGATGYRHNAIANNALADDAGARALMKVVEQDPTQWIAAVAMTRIALVSPEPARTEQAISMVKRTLERDPSNIALQLAWHDLLVNQGKVKESLEFVRAHPHACAAVQHALAESLMLTGDTAAGAKLYMQALSDARPGDLHRYKDDMRVAATLGQIKDFDRTPAAEQAAWIRKFWNFSATAYARSVEARVTEQTVRAAYADRNFRRHEALLSSDNPNWISDSMHIVPWDTRGVTYVRHGAPLHRFRIVKQCLQPFEAWVYSAEDQPWIVWFKRECFSVTGAPRQDDWRPIFAPPHCGDAFIGNLGLDLELARRKYANTPDELDLRDIYSLLSQYDTRYADLVRECAKQPLGAITPTAGFLLYDLRREGIKLFDALQWQESAGHQLAKRVRLIVAAYEFRNEQAKAEVAAVSWIPLSDLGDGESRASSMQFKYVVVNGPLDATRVDGATKVPDSGAGANGILHNVVTIPNPGSGNAKLRVIALDPADTTRGGIRTADLTLRGFGTGYGLSDIVLAVPDVPGALVRGATSVEPLPGHIVDLGQPFRLFFEVYGVNQGDEVKTTVSLKRLDQSALQQLRSLFPGKVASRTLTFPRKAVLDTRGVHVEDVLVNGDLVPGDYAVEVSVSVNGKTSRRSTKLTVIK